jgi:hypothetical protein
MAQQNTHLEHLEDDILNKGSDGGRNAIAFLRELGKMLSEPDSGIRITTKWDGAPAVICGQHPQTKDFFVGTKGVFAKIPKICMTDKDVDLLYSGELANKLKTCLRELPKLGITGVVQGDLLFTKGDVKTATVNGEACYMFQPNTITYAVPQKSEMGKKIAASNIGIVFHTRYSGGPELRDMNASFGVNVNSFKKVNTISVFSSNFTDASGASKFTKAQQTQYDLAVNRAEGSLKQASAFLDILKQTGDGKFLLSAMFKVYFNSFIRRGLSFSSAAAVAKGFEKYYSDTLDKEISTKKQANTKAKYQKIKADGLRFIRSQYRAIYMTVASYMNLIAAKTLVIRQLEKVKSIGTYIKTDSGYRVTAPEGFVAITSGSTLKLVDRLEFSRANFTVEKNWG